MAYKLDLPESAKIHPVIHVSQLKRHVPSTEIVSDELIDPVSVLTPLHLIDTRLVKKGTTTHTELQVQWSGWPEKLTTWEEEFDLRRRYPDAPAWGQAGFLRGGHCYVPDEEGNDGG